MLDSSFLHIELILLIPTYWNSLKPEISKTNHVHENITEKNVYIIISCTEKLFTYLYIYVLGWTLGVIPHLTELGQKDVRTDLNMSFFHENKMNCQDCISYKESHE